jgi:hypothetical protein
MAAGSIESNDGNAKLAEAIERLDRRLAALEVRQMYAKAAEAQAPRAQPGAGSAPLDPGAMKEKERERAAAIDATWRTEPRDSVWAAAAESQIKTAVDDAVKEGGAQFAVKALKCLTSICEVVLSAASPEQLRGTSLQLARRIGEMSRFDVGPPETAADGSAVLTYRMFRSGYPRPDEGI